MRNNRLHTPDGVKDLLVAETQAKADIIDKMRRLFSSYGFMAVETPLLEYIDVFLNETGSAESKNIYKLFDRDGATLAMRGDMTPPMARLCATAFAHEQILRLCYFGNVFRYGENLKGKLHEHWQAGIELIGADGCDADAEVIAIAANSLRNAGLESFKIDIGHIGFLKGLLDETGTDPQQTQKILEMLSVKDYVGVEESAYDSAFSEEAREILLNLSFLSGQHDVLNVAASYAKGKVANSIIDYLKNLYHILSMYGIDKYITFDLGMVSHFNYYTGIVFRGYTYGTGFSILDGGRYDNLLSNFGQQKPAVGFAVKINDVINALQSQNIIDLSSNKKHGTFVMYSPDGKANAIALSRYLREQSKDIRVENSLLGFDLKANLEFAKNSGFEGMLCFENAQDISVYNFIDETIAHTTFDELYESGAHRL